MSANNNASEGRHRPNGRDDRLMKSNAYTKSLSDDLPHDAIKAALSSPINAVQLGIGRNPKEPRLPIQ